MKTNKVIDISLSIPSLTKVWFSSYGSKCCWSIKLQDSLKCNVSRKKWMMKCIFGKQINRSFCKLIVSFEVCVARPGQSTQNKFAYLCGICRKTLDEVFCLWINSNVLYKLIASLWVCIARHVQSTHNDKFMIFLKYLKKNVKD